CTGMGEAYPEEVVRGMMLLRANALCSGYSGIRPEIVCTLIDMLNLGVHPIVPQKGSLGASGDLAPLSHLALVLLGKGEALQQGELMTGAKAMEKAGLPTYTLLAKEGLALINGTQAMCSCGALALHDAINAAKMADIIASMSLEALRGLTSAFEERVQSVRPQKGQSLVARNLRSLCRDSEILSISSRSRVQDAYTLRCILQVHGAVRVALSHVQDIVQDELNAVTDNPLIFAEDGAVISGGNFHGEPLAMAFDYLGIAAAELASISERRLERMVNPQLSGLPAFLVKNGGLNSGMMIVQYSAASMVSENKIYAHPASVDSIPSSANQEDHVSMGATAARKARLIVENTLSVLALELMCACQGIDLIEEEASPVHQSIHKYVREFVDYYDRDREIRLDIDQMNKIIRSDELLRMTKEMLPDFE
ncbi:MAG: histidine ammonia-lyase, partial [Clostridiales bacterium]|nr:histidine ammonia-lyase [Clostridiales bacterium]